MRRAVLGDTGPLFAAADPSDQYHSRARGELERLERDRIDVVVAYPTLFEAYSLVLQNLGPRIAHRWLKELSGAVLFVNPPVEDYQQAAERVRSYADQDISLFDALLTVVARRLSLPVWTYDHHFDVMKTPVWR